MHSSKIKPSFPDTSGKSSHTEEKIPNILRRKPLSHSDSFPNDSMDRAESSKSTTFVTFRRLQTQSSINSGGSRGETIAAVENLINFLTLQEESIASSPDLMKRFELLTMEALNNIHDPEMYRLFRMNGWNGARYRATDDVPLDVSACLQSLSNWYLKQTRGTDLSHIYDIFGKGDVIFLLKSS